MKNNRHQTKFKILGTLLTFVYFHIRKASDGFPNHSNLSSNLLTTLPRFYIEIDRSVARVHFPHSNSADVFSFAFVAL